MKKYVICWILYVLKLISALHQNFAIEISKRLASHFILCLFYFTQHKCKLFVIFACHDKKKLLINGSTGTSINEYLSYNSLGFYCKRITVLPQFLTSTPTLLQALPHYSRQYISLESSAIYAINGGTRIYYY